jgi:hypothetical protein
VADAVQRRINRALKESEEQADSLRCTLMILRHKMEQLGVTHVEVNAETGEAILSYRSSYSVEIDK